LELFVLFIIWAGLSWGVAALATSRGRSGVAFFFVAFLTTPLLGLIIVLLMKNLTAEAEKEAARRAEDDVREKRRREEHELQLESLRSLSSTVSARPPEAAASAQGSFSLSTELEKLADLKSRGILTDTEFSEQKAVLLKRGAT
jgi:hypothetical protein